MSGSGFPSLTAATALALAACGPAETPASDHQAARSAPVEIEEVAVDSLTAPADAVNDSESMGSANAGAANGQ